MSLVTNFAIYNLLSYHYNSHTSMILRNYITLNLMSVIVFGWHFSPRATKFCGVVFIVIGTVTHMQNKFRVKNGCIYINITVGNFT